MEQSLHLDLLEQRRHRALNRLHTTLLVAGSLTLLGATAYVFSGLTGVILAIGFGIVALAAMQRISPKMVLTMYKAQPAGPALFPTGNRIVTELARRAGLATPPKLYIVPSTVLNAFAVGRRDDSAIAITDALVRALTPRELTGVLAHEMSHIAHEDLKVMALADIVTRYTSIMSTAGFFSLFFNLAGVAGGFGPGVPWLAVALLMGSPTIGALLQLALSRTREFDADLSAAILTGDPDGLAFALKKLERAQGKMWESMALPGGRVPDPSLLRSHPRTDERVERLMALKTHDGLAIPHKTARRRGASVPVVGDASTFSLVGPDPMPEEENAQFGFDEATGKPRIRVRRGGVWW